MRSVQRSWLEPEPLRIPPGILEVAGGNDLIAAALVRRGVRSVSEAREFIHPTEPGLNQPFRLPGMQAAVDLILKAIQSTEKIGIWGDFDTDGQTSAAVLVHALRSLDADVAYHLPIRGPESHGITLPYLKKFLSDGIRLLITCDTGISEVEAARYCRQAGVDMIITDHHVLPLELPDASVLINPHFLPGEDLLAPLCGVGTAFQLAKALLSRSGDTHTLEQYYDLVALGTLADVARLTGENRFLVKRGLEDLKLSRRLAIRTILNNAKVDPLSMNEDLVTFYLAPRFNAVGRLSDPNPVVEFLLSDDAQFVNTYALQIEGLNGQRRILLQNVESAALRQLEQDPSLLDGQAIFLTHPLWPGGVLGLLAGKLAELFQRPAFVLRLGEDGIARGSVRSVEGVDIIQAITRCGELLLSSGGHPKAAGLSLRVEDLPRFQTRIDQEILASHPDGISIPSLEIEAYLGFAQIDSAMVDQINQLSPFGEGNPEIILATHSAEILEVKPLGKDQEHAKLLIRDGSGEIREVLHWQSRGLEYPEGKFDLAFTLKKGSFRGKPQVNCEWVGFRQDQTNPLVLRSKPLLNILDRRLVNITFAEINDLAYHPGIVIFREGALIAQIPRGYDRLSVCEAEELIITAPPPNWEILSQVMTAVKPKKVLVFDLVNATGTLHDELNRLSGLVKFVINKKGGQSSISELAILCGQTDNFIRLGLDFLAARGDIHIQGGEEKTIRIQAPGHPAEPERTLEIENALLQVYQETRAFRDYYRTAELNDFFFGF